MKNKEQYTELWENGKCDRNSADNE